LGGVSMLCGPHKWDEKKTGRKELRLVHEHSSYSGFNSASEGKTS
jgi:hypothetical protein